VREEQRRRGAHRPPLRFPPTASPLLHRAASRAACHAVPGRSRPPGRKARRTHLRSRSFSAPKGPPACRACSRSATCCAREPRADRTPPSTARA
jgi:hypothetical protein